MEKRGYITLSDDGEFKPHRYCSCYEIINTDDYKSFDCISWYIKEYYKNYHWEVDNFINPDEV